MSEVHVDISKLPEIKTINYHADSLGYTIEFEGCDVVMELRCGFTYKYEKPYAIYSGRLHGIVISNAKQVYRFIRSEHEQTQSEINIRLEELTRLGFI